MEIEDNDNGQDPATMSSTMKRCLLARNKLAVIIRGPAGDAEYCCVQCPVKCNCKEDLEQHLFTHNKEYRHLCGICGTGLKRKEHLDRHTLEHQQVRPHVCEICSKAFKRKEHLTIHKSIHSGDKNEICMLCHKSFYRKDHLQKHLQTHSKIFIEQNIDQDFPGIKAEVMELDASDQFDDSSQDAMGIEDIEITPDQGSIVIAEEPVVQKEVRPYACDLCDKTYKRKDHLKLHSQTHLKKEKICIQCGRAFLTDERLLQHMVHVHSMVKSEEDTTHLQALLAEHNIDPNFTDNSLLVPRMSVPHADEDARRHECNICHRKFKRRQHLIVHQNVHNKTQPNIWCSRCNEGFFCNQSFESHSCMNEAVEFLDIKIEPSPPIDHNVTHPPDKKENEHPHIKILPLEPSEDSTVYRIRDESALPSPRRVYVCKFCSKPFKRKDHYKIHLHIHTGVKSFFCDVCGKGFYRKDHLQKHEWVHTKPKPKPKPKKALPDLFPINKLPKKIEKVENKNNAPTRKEVLPEITIHAPSNTKLRVPLQIKVPYQMVMSMDNGEERAVTIDPSKQHEAIL